MNKFEKLENMARGFLNECVKAGLTFGEIAEVLRVLDRAQNRAIDKLSKEVKNMIPNPEAFDVPDGDIESFKHRWGEIK